MGYFRIVAGKNALGIESEVAWATPGAFSIHNKPCNEDASNCGGGQHVYADPSINPAALKELRRDRRV